MEPKKKLKIKVMTQYGSTDIVGSSRNAFVASPSLSSPIDRNIRLLNINSKQHPRTPAKLSRSDISSSFHNLLNKTTNSPFFRPISPQISSRSLLVRRKNSGSVESSAVYSFPKTQSQSIHTASDDSSQSHIHDADDESTQLTKTKGAKLTKNKKNAKEKEVALMSVWHAGFNIINLFLGLGLLSFPYAMKEGSFMSIFALAFICFAMSYTGKLIVKCFNHESINDNDRSYPAVGHAALGKFGVALISFGIIFEFVGGLCMSIIFIWYNLQYLIPQLSNFQAAMICTLAVLPTCWLLNFRELTFTSILGCICKIFTVSVIALNFFLNTNVVNETEYDMYPTNAQSFSVSTGIFILSYAGHACLPSIYTQMKEPKKFNKMLDVCFFVMFLTYSAMAVFGYLQYGRATAVVITANMVGEDVDFYQAIVARVLIAFVIASIYFQVSPLLGIVAEIPEQVFEKYINSPLKQRIFRTFLFMICTLISWIVVEHLAILEAVTGSLCTMITAVICPTLFYFALNSQTVSKFETFIIFVYVTVGILFGMYLLYNDILFCTTMTH